MLTVRVSIGDVGLLLLATATFCSPWMIHYFAAEHKYLNDDQMDWHEIMYRHSWSPKDEPYSLLQSLTQSSNMTINLTCFASE